MVNLKLFLYCLMPIGLLVMSGCSPPKAAPVSQAGSVPPNPVASAQPVTSSENAVAAVAAAPVADPNAGLNSNPAVAAAPVDPSAGSQPEDSDRSEQGSNMQPGAGEPTESSAGEADPEAMERNAPPKLPDFPGPTGKTGTDIGDMIPEIKGKDIDKQSFKLTDYSGRVLMVDFWGDW